MLVDEEIELDKQGRMLYHPEFHPNNKRPYTESELEYLCKYWEVDHWRTVSFALGRTEASLSNMVSILKREGRYEYYKNLGRHW